MLRIYFDDLRAGHAYLEIFKSDDERHGELIGLYPERFDGETEILIDLAELREDRDRLTEMLNDPNHKVISATYSLDENELARLQSCIARVEESKKTYVLIGNNCVDFLHDAYRSSRGDEQANFLESFDRVELAQLS